MIFVNGRLVLVITYRHDLPEHLVLHCNAAEAADVGSRRIIIIMVHAMCDGKVGTLHSEGLRMLVHQLVKLFEAFRNFEFESGFLDWLFTFDLLLLL